MNKKAYRLIFSKSRGMLVAVAEIVVGHVKGSTPVKAPQVVAIDSVFTLFPIKAISLSACLLLGSALQLVQAQNLPTGGKVVGGAAAIAQPNANKMEITQTTPKAVINWNAFNVGAGNTVQFIQPSSSSQVLNRVVGITGGSSQILGTLTANGQVFIVNPQGIVFGNGAMVNVGALLASTRDIAPNAFMAGGNLQFNANNSANTSGLISNAGSLNASSGFVVLAADQIRNTGSINAPGGQVVLTAGDQATLSLSNGQLVQFTVNSNTNQNTNNLSIASSGIIQAQDGKIVLNANATNILLNSVINLSGVVSAQGGAVGIDAGANSKVNLDTATVDVSRQGAPAGNITVSAQEIAVANSRLLASGSNSNSSKGGTVILAGNGANKSSQVAVEDSIIDVSANNFSSVGSASNTGSKGGTAILLGNRVALLGNSTIDASGTHGGGAVVIGGDQLGKVGALMPVPLANQTYIGSNSTILIGSSAGDGGFVETSGQTLTMLGSVKGASQGKNGEWLIDPTDITINAVSNTNVTNTSNVWAGAGTNTTGTVLNTSITDALATGTNVTVTTVSSGTAGGNLTVAADLVVTNPSNSTLTLFANQTLTFNGGNVCATGSGTLGLDATAANGTLIINNTNVSLNGGTATLSGNGSARNINGVNITGDVFFNGNDQISITGSGNSSSQGVYLSGNLTQNNGVLNITGANSNGTNGLGYYQVGSVIQNNGSLNITGTSQEYRGAFFGGNLTQNNGSINIVGVSNSSNASVSGNGFYLSGGRIIQYNGSLNITGTSKAYIGAHFDQYYSLIQEGGTLNITGSSNSHYGMYSNGNLIQNNGIMNIVGTSYSSKTGFYHLGTQGNLTQNNGTLNITGFSNTGNGATLQGNITQTVGSLIVNTVKGDLNQYANISIANNLQLLAGTSSAAGNTSGGNVNLGLSINLSNNGTLTIFSGNPNTAAYQANITGANSTGVDYKTYNASVANISPVNGTQNFYYRSAPTANVTVNNKVYDTTTNASSIVSGAVDGDTLQASGIRFNNASAGSQTVNSSDVDITSANSSWVVNGYSVGNVSPTATIAKANVTLNVAATVNNKVYDTTTNASLVSNSSGIVQLGNATTADGSLAANTTFGPTGVGSTGSFINASAGNQTVILSNALIDTANYTLVSGGTLNTSATIAKANVTLAGASADNKVYDTTTNASISNNGTATVVLGNSTLADGSLNSSTAFTNYTVSGAFANASAGNQTVNLTTVLADSTNYTVSGSSQTNTNTTIAKANVNLNVPGTVSDKPYDGTTSATVMTNSSGVVQLGNASLANGSLATNTTFGPAGVDTTGVFASPLPGQQTVNLVNTLKDTANYTLASGSTLTTSAEIFSNSNAQTVLAASSSSGYILQGLSSSGGSSGSASSKADSSSSSAPSSASASSQGGSGSTAKEDQKGSTASASTGTVSVTPSPGGDVPIPAVPMIALAD